MEISMVSALTCVVLAAGLTSSWLIRQSMGASLQSFCQAFFLTSLACVGLATIALLAFHSGVWILGVATFSLMVLAATWTPYERPENQWC